MNVASHVFTVKRIRYLLKALSLILCFRISCKWHLRHYKRHEPLYFVKPVAGVELDRMWQ